MSKVRLKLVLTLMALMLSWGLTRAGNTLVVQLTNGGLQHFALTENPVLTMSGSRMNISTTTVQTSWERSNIARFFFDDVSGVEALKKDAVVFRQIGESQLEITGLTVKDNVLVSNLSGQTFSDCVSRNNTQAVVDLNGCPKGIYVIKVGKQTIKITKK